MGAFSPFAFSATAFSTDDTLTQDQIDLRDFAIDSLPPWIRQHDEFLTAAAVMFSVVKNQITYLFDQTLITHAEGPTATTPDWLAQHARDRDTFRQVGETDPVLQQRLRLFPDALTRQALLDVANALIAAAGVSGTAALIELPRDGAWAGRYTAMSGTGGTFLASSPATFIPSALPWPVPPWIDPSVFPGTRMRLVITGAGNAGNNGTFEVTGLRDDYALFTNGSAVTAVEAAASWTVQHMDVLGNVTDGFAMSFAGCGFRAARRRPRTMIMMLPFGSDQGLENSVREALRLKKTAGSAVLVERRLVP